MSGCAKCKSRLIGNDGHVIHVVGCEYEDLKETIGIDNDMGFEEWFKKTHVICCSECPKEKCRTKKEIRTDCRIQLSLHTTFIAGKKEDRQEYKLLFTNHERLKTKYIKVKDELNMMKDCPIEDDI